MRPEYDVGCEQRARTYRFYIRSRTSEKCNVSLLVGSRAEDLPHGVGARIFALNLLITGRASVTLHILARCGFCLRRCLISYFHQLVHRLGILNTFFVDHSILGSDTYDKV